MECIETQEWQRDYNKLILKKKTNKKISHLKIGYKKKNQINSCFEPIVKMDNCSTIIDLRVQEKLFTELYTRVYFVVSVFVVSVFVVSVFDSVVY